MLVAVILGVMLAAGTLGLLVLVMREATAYTCEVCITYRGRTRCRTAAGATREEAVRTATDNACAFLASGMTESIRCTNTAPDRVTCEPPE